MSAAWCQRSGVSGLVSAVWCQQSGVSGLVSAVWCQRPGVSGLVSAAWCQQPDVSNLLLPPRRRNLCAIFTVAGYVELNLLSITCSTTPTIEASWKPVVITHWPSHWVLATGQRPLFIYSSFCFFPMRFFVRYTHLSSFDYLTPYSPTIPRSGISFVFALMCMTMGG